METIAADTPCGRAHTAHVRECLPKIYTRELVNVIFEQPYYRIGNLVEKDIAQRQSASRYLKELAAIGVLREVQAGKEKLFIHPKLMQLLADDRNAFAPYACPRWSGALAANAPNSLACKGLRGEAPLQRRQAGQAFGADVITPLQRRQAGQAFGADVITPLQRMQAGQAFGADVITPPRRVGPRWSGALAANAPPTELDQLAALIAAQPDGLGIEAIAQALGNTYSRLDTERLIEFGQATEGKTALETQMILNHKQAIEYLVLDPSQAQVTPDCIVALHAFLSDGLMADPTAVGRLRRRFF